MIQWILVIIILALSMTYAARRLYIFWKKPHKAEDKDCDGCSSDCTTCPFVTKFEISEKG